MPTSASDALQFTITEQTGDKRQLVLSERALPYRPIEFSGDQRAEFTSYPGNPIRTLQVLGPEEEPTEFSGFWKDRFIGDQSRLPGMAYVTQNGAQTSLFTVVDLIALVNDIRRKGQEVVVQWGPEVYRGLLRRFSRRWHNIHDAEWTMRFEWISANDPEVPLTLARDTDHANVQNTLQAKLAEILAILAAPQDIAATEVSNLVSYAVQIETFVDQVGDTTSSVLDTGMPIVDQQRRLAGIMNDVAASSDAMSAFVTSTPAAALATPTAAAPTEGVTLTVEYMLRQLVSALRDMKFLALSAQQDILKSINPNILAMFTASAATDLRDVSTDFFDTPDEWRSIMVFNQLADSRLSAGQAIFVPNLLRPLDGSQ